MNICKEIEKTEAQYKARTRQVKVSLIYDSETTACGSWRGKVVSDINPLKSGSSWTTTFWWWDAGAIWRGTHKAGGYGYDKESNNMAHIIMNMYHYKNTAKQGESDNYIKEYRDFTDVFGDRIEGCWESAMRERGLFLLCVL